MQLQCVVALRPSSSPAPASRNEPEHTLVTRRDCPLQASTKRRSRAEPSAARVPSPPATTRVSIAAGLPRRAAASVTPELLATGPGRSAMTRSW